MNAFFNIGLAGVLERFHFCQYLFLFFPPCPGLLFKEDFRNLAIQLIHIHAVYSGFQPFVFALQPAQGFLMVLPLVRMAFFQGLAYPVQNIIVKAQLFKGLPKLPFQLLFLDVGGAFCADSPIIDVLALFQIPDKGAARIATLDQPREGKVMFADFPAPRSPVVKNVLYGLPQFQRDNRRILSFIKFAVPFKFSSVNTASQDFVDARLRNAAPAFFENQPCVFQHGGDFLHGMIAGCVPFEGFGNQRRCFRVRRYGFLAVLVFHVHIAQRRIGRPYTLLRLLRHTLAGFFGKVVDIVLRHENFDTVHEFFGRPRIPAQDHAFFGKVYLQSQFIERHPVPDISVKSIYFFHHDRLDCRIRFQICQHIGKARPAGLFGRFNVHKFLGDNQAVLAGVFVQKAQLGGY